MRIDALRSAAAEVQSALRELGKSGQPPAHVVVQSFVAAESTLRRLFPDAGTKPAGQLLSELRDKGTKGRRLFHDLMNLKDRRYFGGAHPGEPLRQHDAELALATLKAYLAWLEDQLPPTESHRPATTNVERILQIVGNYPEGICNKHLEKLTGVSPVQQVYQIVARLTRQGKVARKKGSCSVDGKQRLIVVPREDAEGCLPVTRHEQQRRASSPSSLDRLAPESFKLATKAFFDDSLQEKMEEEVAWKLSDGSMHKFDLATTGRSVFIEVKSITWTRSGYYPGGKIAEVRHDVSCLKKIHTARRLLVIQDHYWEGKSLAETFVRRNRQALAGLEVWVGPNPTFKRIYPP